LPVAALTFISAFEQKFKGENYGAFFCFGKINIAEEPAKNLKLTD
jgi:hypothetical protein